MKTKTISLLELKLAEKYSSVSNKLASIHHDL